MLHSSDTGILCSSCLPLLSQPPEESRGGAPVALETQELRARPRERERRVAVRSEGPQAPPRVVAEHANALLLCVCVCVYLCIELAKHRGDRALEGHHRRLAGGVASGEESEFSWRRWRWREVAFASRLFIFDDFDSHRGCCRCRRIGWTRPAIELSPPFVEVETGVARTPAGVAGSRRRRTTHRCVQRAEASCDGGEREPEVATSR